MTLSQILADAQAAVTAAQSTLAAAQLTVTDLQAYIAANPPAPPPPPPPPAPAPAPTGTWTTIAQEWVVPYNGTHPTFTITAAQAPALCQFGTGTTWLQKTFAAGTYSAQLSTFGTTDPAPGVSKEVQLWVPTPAPAPAPAPATPPVFVAQPGLVLTGSVVTVDTGTQSPPATSFTYVWSEYTQAGTFVGNGSGASYTVVNANDVVSCILTPYNGAIAGASVAIPGVIVP
jgi:hypothetical protein